VHSFVRHEPAEPALRHKLTKRVDASRAYYCPISLQLVIAPVHRSRFQSHAVRDILTPHIYRAIYPPAHIYNNRCLEANVFCANFALLSAGFAKTLRSQSANSKEPFVKGIFPSHPVLLFHTYHVCKSYRVAYQLLTPVQVTMVSCTARGECCQGAYCDSRPLPCVPGRPLTGSSKPTPPSLSRHKS